MSSNRQMKHLWALVVIAVSLAQPLSWKLRVLWDFGRLATK